VVERGSLDYTIVVRDEFSGTIEKFRAELLAASAAFKSFSQQGADLNAQTKSLRATAAAAKSLTKASEELNTTQRRGASALSQAVTLEERAERAALSAADAREIKTIADKRGLDLSRDIVQQNRLRESGLKRLAKQERAVAEAEVARAASAEKRQGPQISDREQQS